MEIKINKEIRSYRENLFMGLSFRQLACSVGAVLTAISTYFLLKNILSQETASWICMVLASPIVAVGFFNYNGLNFEKFIWEFIKSEFLLSGIRIYKSEPIYLDVLKQNIRNKKLN